MYRAAKGFSEPRVKALISIQDNGTQSMPENLTGLI